MIRERNVEAGLGGRGNSTVHGLTLETLCEQYRLSYQSLYRQAMRIVGSAEAAEDVLQQAFVNSAAAIKRGVKVESLAAWLRAVVRNVALMQLDAKPTIPLEEEFVRSDVGPTAEAIHIVKERCNDIYRMAEGLPNAQRSAFLLAEVHGLDYGEIAEALNCSETSVHGLLQRARASVRNQAGEDVLVS